MNHAELSMPTKTTVTYASIGANLKALTGELQPAASRGTAEARIPPGYSLAAVACRCFLVAPNQPGTSKQRDSSRVVSADHMPHSGHTWNTSTA